jgi:endonuclease/exonuclease/phosphatase family metal-dependent hydrolase
VFCRWLQELFIFRLGPFALLDNYGQFVTGMRQLGYAHSTDPRPSIPFVGQNDGLAIFSKRPFCSPSKSHKFNVSGELVCNKGFLQTTIEVGKRKVHLVTTHLDSKKKPKNVKEMQVAQMAGVLLPLMSASPLSACIAAGDFNICSRGSKDDGTAYRALKSGLAPLVDMYDGPEVAPTRRPDTKPWARGKKKGKEGGGAIDHAFVSGLKPVSSNVRDFRCADGTVVSDHLGMEFEVSLAK